MPPRYEYVWYLRVECRETYKRIGERLGVCSQRAFQIAHSAARRRGSELRQAGLNVTSQKMFELLKRERK